MFGFKKQFVLWFYLEQFAGQLYLWSEFNNLRVYSSNVYIFHTTLESVGKCFFSIIVLERIDNLNILFLNI